MNFHVQGFAFGAESREMKEAQTETFNGLSVRKE